MPSPLLSLILDRIHDHGPMTVREFVDQALYHEPLGYYASAQQRSGRGGDFFTSVDLGPMFGELLATQFVEMWERMGRCEPFDLVEAAAGNGRLARDILDCAATRHADFYRVIRLHLAERSPRARERHREVLGTHLDKLSCRPAGLSDRVTGVVYANELLDALPPHLVVMRDDGLREIYVDEVREVLSQIHPGGCEPWKAPFPRRESRSTWNASVHASSPAGSPRSTWLPSDWVQDAAKRLERGFLVLVDYGHEAATLYSASRAAGTLATFRRHASEARESGPGWLLEPGERDITSHVDLTGVRLAGLAAGLECLGTVDQTYFLLGLGLAARLLEDGAADDVAIKRRLALKTLLLPGGMGSTHKVLIFGKRVDAGALRGLSGGRLT